MAQSNTECSFHLRQRLSVAVSGERANLLVTTMLDLDYRCLPCAVAMRYRCAQASPNCYRGPYLMPVLLVVAD